jgi:hypothetical protein
MASDENEFGETTMEWFEAAERKDTVKPVIMSASAARWFEGLLGHGLFVVDMMGRTTLAPQTREVLGALNEVLAGGKVEVRLVSPGNAFTKKQLDDSQKKIE